MPQRRLALTALLEAQVRRHLAPSYARLATDLPMRRRHEPRGSFDRVSLDVRGQLPDLLLHMDALGVVPGVFCVEWFMKVYITVGAACLVPPLCSATRHCCYGCCC